MNLDQRLSALEKEVADFRRQFEKRNIGTQEQKFPSNEVLKIWSRLNFIRHEVEEIMIGLIPNNDALFSTQPTHKDLPEVNSDIRVLFK